jgi:hypothetical protein
MKTGCIALLCTLFIAVPNVQAGNCLVQGSKKIGDCEGVTVNVGPGKPLNVKSSGYFSGNYGSVVVYPGADASISGNTDEIIVKRGAMLSLNGNSGNIRVEGEARLMGNADWVFVAKGGTVTISGIVSGVSGPGKVIRLPGAIVNGVYIR